MVSFTCNTCQDVVKKPKVVGHQSTCRTNSFTCVDCMQVFDSNTIKSHTSCVTEVEKYQGQWLQNKVKGTMRMERKPAPRMDDLSDDDDDWVPSKRGAKAPTAAVAPSGGHKRSRSASTEAPRKQAKEPINCQVPSFVLGSSSEICEVVEEIIRETSSSQMKRKELAKELVSRYASRIAKQLRTTLDEALSTSTSLSTSDGIISIN